MKRMLVAMLAMTVGLCAGQAFAQFGGGGVPPSSASIIGGEIAYMGPGVGPVPPTVLYSQFAAVGGPLVSDCNMGWAQNWRYSGCSTFPAFELVDHSQNDAVICGPFSPSADTGLDASPADGMSQQITSDLPKLESINAGDRIDIVAVAQGSGCHGGGTMWVNAEVGHF